EEIRSADIDVVGAIFTMSGNEENSRYYKRKGYLRYGGYYGRRKRRNSGYGSGYGYGNGNGYGYGYGNEYGYGYGGYGYGYGGYGYGYGGYGYGPGPGSQNSEDKQIDKK
ncbi:MAG: hypothetical protein U0K91_05105, partial [Acutalibacteraceae bacterium]|nr:hypothetical protein [Acutalibacteraceae bacterium]